MSHTQQSERGVTDHECRLNTACKDHKPQLVQYEFKRHAKKKRCDICGRGTHLQVITRWGMTFRICRRCIRARTAVEAGWGGLGQAFDRWVSD